MWRLIVCNLYEKNNQSRPAFTLATRLTESNKIAGTVNGMTIQLDPDLENYAPLNLQTNQDAGFLLALGYEPEYLTISTPTVLRPGSHSWLAVQAAEEMTTFFGNGRHILYDILARGNPLGFADADVPCNPEAKLSVLSGMSCEYLAFPAVYCN